MTIVDGVKLGLGIAGTFAALWITGWVLVLVIVFFDEVKTK